MKAYVTCTLQGLLNQYRTTMQSDMSQKEIEQVKIYNSSGACVYSNEYQPNKKNTSYTFDRGVYKIFLKENGKFKELINVARP